MLETQDWWTVPGAPVEGGSQHIHLSTCFPLDQTLSGTVPFDLHVQLHLNPGRLSQVDLQVFGTGVDVTQVAANPNFTCPTAQCDLWYHIDYDTTRVPVDGYLEFRFHAKVIAPDGSIGHTATGWQATIANGGGRMVKNYRTPPWIEARGWYTGVEYENARLTSTLPNGSVSGVWTFGCKLDRGSGGTPATHVLVTLDPKFHADPVDRGRPVFEQNGPFTGTLSIDTTTLTNGVHKLFMRTDSSIATGVGSGVQVVLFRVDNGVAAGALNSVSDFVQQSAPLWPSVMLLAILALNLPWRGAVRPRAASVRNRAIRRPMSRVVRSRLRRMPVPARRERSGSQADAAPVVEGLPVVTNKEATWSAYRRAMADPAWHDDAEAGARAWLDSMDRQERWG
jgi:hypothetical protein